MSDVAVVERPKVEAMRIVTGCKTPEQFVAAFYRFCDAKTCFIPTSDTRPVGSMLAFSLRLADGTPMLRGTCRVKAAWETKDNAFKRPGVQLEIEKLSSESTIVFEQLLSQKTAVVDVPPEVKDAPSDGIVEEVPRANTNQHVPRGRALDLLLRTGRAPVVKKLVDRSEEKTAPLPKVDPVAPTVAAPILDTSSTPTIEMPPLHKDETRTPGSAFVLPANPLSDVDDAGLDQFLASTISESDGSEPDDDLAIPVAAVQHASREQMKTLLGFAPLAPAVKRDTEKSPAVPKPATDHGTAPLAFATRGPAMRTFSNPLQSAMTGDERFWYMCALLAALFVVGIVALSAFVFG